MGHGGGGLRRALAGALMCALGVGVGSCFLFDDPTPAEPSEPTTPVPCTSSADCCDHSPASLCGSPSGTCEYNPFCAQDPRCFGSRFGQCDGGPPGGPGHPPSGPACPTFAVGSGPLGPPPFYCGPPGTLTTRFIADLNTFWQSGLVACACDTADVLAFGCQGNGFVMPDAPGYIFYDRALLDHLASSTGAGLSAAWFLAHEAGHNVQLRLGMPYPSGKARELGADCLAGYFVAWLECEGLVDSSFTGAAFATACQIGDPFASPWFAEQAHGTCHERQSAVQHGYSAYASGLSPAHACR